MRAIIHKRVKNRPILSDINCLNLDQFKSFFKNRLYPPEYFNQFFEACKPAPVDNKKMALGLFYHRGPSVYL
jgi:hypothetical protein